jgi:hypothetical protein
VPAALGLKIDSGLQHLGVMFPLRFAGTHRHDDKSPEAGMCTGFQN